MALVGCKHILYQPDVTARMVGVKIYDIDDDSKSLFAEWSELGVNAVFADPKLVDNKFSALAKKYGIETFIILPIFFNPEALHENPDLYAITDQGEKAIEEWVEFACPSRDEYRKRRIKEINALVRKLRPDGISLDFIRHFVYWEKVYSNRSPNSLLNTCFCSHCLDLFQADQQIRIPSSLKDTPQISDWINANCSAEWTEWKCGLITRMVEEVVREARLINPKLRVNVHAVPWRQDDFSKGIKRIAGQDIAAIAPFTDIISPMTYSHMVKREPEWINSVVKDIADQAGGIIIPTIQVNRAYLPEPLTAEEFRQCVIEALKHPSAGIVLWSWEQLNKSPEKKEIFKALINHSALR